MTDAQGGGNPLSIAYGYVAMLLGFGAMTAISLVWLPFAMLFYLLLPRSLGKRWGRYVIMAGFRTSLYLVSCLRACRFDLSEVDRLRGEGPLILAANHPSRLDAVLIVSRLSNVACVAKTSLIDNGLFGVGARLARYIRNSPPLEMILSAREELQDGAQLLIFPEGTRTVKFPLDACTPATGLISQRAGTPVQTLIIEFSSPYLGKGWPLFKPPSLPLHCRIRLGRRFPPPVDVAGFTAELDAYFRHELENAQKAPSTAAVAR
jgi:1-acyl-sn-glycerol-3-phosphate acyltransferase